jgi:hypothetical protein
MTAAWVLGRAQAAGLLEIELEHLTLGMQLFSLQYECLVFAFQLQGTGNIVLRFPHHRLPPVESYVVFLFGLTIRIPL